MKPIFVLLCLQSLFLSSSFAAFAEEVLPAATVPPTVPAVKNVGTPQVKKPQHMYIFDQRPQAAFNSQVAPVLQTEFNNCKDCNYVNFAVYEAAKTDTPTTAAVKDQLPPKPTNTAMATLPAHPQQALGEIAVLLSQAPILFFNSNMRAGEANAEWISYLNEYSKAGGLVVFAAGQPADHKQSAPLAQTLAGKIDRALIIGELGERDRLWGASFYGPEMFTAIRPPKDLIGQEIAPVIFAARLTKNINRRPDWPAYLQSKKMASHKIWLELGDLFY